MIPLIELETVPGLHSVAIVHALPGVNATDAARAVRHRRKHDLSFTVILQASTFTKDGQYFKQPGTQNTGERMICLYSVPEDKVRSTKLLQKISLHGMVESPGLERFQQGCSPDPMQD